MKQRIKQIQILIMLCILTAPVLLLAVKPTQVYPINENRVRKEFPAEWKQMFLKNGEYGKELSDYFDDQFQFRDFFIRTKGELEHRLFQVTGENGVYVGDDGYMYYKSVVEGQQIVNEQLLEDKVDEIVRTYESFFTDAKSLGIECMLMIPPQKNTIFPERAPKFHVERKNPNQYEKLMQKLLSSSVSDEVIDVVPPLRKAETEYPTYYKTDFHWNPYGATVAFTEVVNLLAKKEGIYGKIFDSSMYDIYYDPQPWGERGGGGQLDNLPILEKIKEDCAVCVKQKTEPTMLADAGQLPDAQIKHYKNTNTEVPFGKIFFVGDSYTQFFLNANCGILDLFEEVWFVHVNRADGVLAQYAGQVDYMMVESIESSMASLQELLTRIQQ